MVKIDKKALKKSLEAVQKEAHAHVEEQKKIKIATRSTFFEKISRLLPKSFTTSAETLLRYSGKEEAHVESWVGKIFIYSIVLSLATATASYFGSITNEFYTLIVGVVIFIIAQSTPYFRLSIAADKRAKDVEVVLPSALQLISANIRAGMTPDRAIWLSARPEFGALMIEIKKAGAETIGGTPLTIAFQNMSKRVRSRILERTVLLVVEGLESGGELGKLLSETAAEIRSLDILRKEMDANIAMYSMFIIFAGMIGAPFLLAISGFFVEMLTKLSAVAGLEGEVSAKAQEAGVSLLTFSTSITPEFLLYFSIFVISITTFFSALLLGLIKYGDEKRGLEMAPLFVMVGLAIFLIVKIFITNSFGAAFGT
ncbi:MAG TPA: type II secretion system F family protein [Candidatus Nanoarchaeia archaeon]|uniref:Type II secretion system F family protein n=1 Tax=Candidatus Naiadarchaeum limnaeum TaxID=2756139 RepID=A0A832X637_9ARCH|nr:type II secretion system F family protein [Candidatus Naiadarchaeales archaeon SRR2090153.bin1042]HIK00470.1 type II secretion system F family protein [Candidatus Naiadarchaeum limnaeum]HLD18580.1 type II secretion system F family protein [Candidatus Nanoarchaeia archaeon]